MGIVGNLTPAELDFFNSQGRTLPPLTESGGHLISGYLVIESFASPEEIDSMRKRMEQLLKVFDHSATASIFSTKSQMHLTTDYFYESTENISLFFEEKAFGDDGKLKQSKELSINKVGHGMQPGIRGEVSPHHDNSFLYTDPPNCKGLWLALEDATIKNGCLLAIPGSHKSSLFIKVLKIIPQNQGMHTACMWWILTAANGWEIIGLEEKLSQSL